MREMMDLRSDKEATRLSIQKAVEVKNELGSIIDSAKQVAEELGA